MQKIGGFTETANPAGEFTEGNPVGGVAATLIKADWLNGIQRELVSLVEAAGLTLDAQDTTQVKQAVQVLLAAANTWSALNSKPSTIAGFGITDAFTKTEINTALAAKAPLASPALTGTPTAPTAAAGTSTTQLATTAFVAAVQTLLNAAIALKAPLASPALTGTPTAPTASVGTSTTQLATTAFVQAAVAALVNSSPAALDTLAELATALGNDANFAATMTNALAAKAPLASPGLTGTPTAPTAAAGTSTTQLATTAFVAAVQTLLNAAIALKAPLASPALTGTPTAPTASVGTSTTQLATTAFVAAGLAAQKNTASLAASGWWRDEDTGLMKQWITVSRGDIASGHSTANNEFSVTWPTTFPTAALYAQVSIKEGTTGRVVSAAAGYYALTTSTGTFYCEEWSATVENVSVVIEITGY